MVGNVVSIQTSKRNHFFFIVELKTKYKNTIFCNVSFVTNKPAYMRCEKSRGQFDFALNYPLVEEKLIIFRESGITIHGSAPSSHIHNIKWTVKWTHQMKLASKTLISSTKTFSLTFVLFVGQAFGGFITFLKNSATGAEQRTRVSPSYTIR